MNGLIIVDASILSLLSWLTVACAGVIPSQQHIDVVWYMPGNAVEMLGRYDITYYYFYYEYSKWMVWSLLIHRFCHCCHDSLWLVQGYDWVSSRLIGSSTCLSMQPWCWDGMISRSIIFITNIHLGLFDYCWCIDFVIAAMTHCGLCRGMIGSATQWWGLSHACQCCRSVWNGMISRSIIFITNIRMNDLSIGFYGLSLIVWWLITT